jgi:membrane protease subunit (stomatin/prohibitin family)
MLRDCPDFSEIGVRILEIGELKISVSAEDQARIDELQDQLAGAKMKARVAKAGISQAEAEAQQKQFELDQKFQNEARYANLAGSYQGYAAGRAMIGAGEGMARGGDSGLAGAGAQLAIGAGMAGLMQQGAVAYAPIPQAVAPAASAGAKLTCPKCSAQVPSGKFCQECGGALAVAPPKKFCAGCGSDLIGAKFCANCGAAAPAP